MRRAEERADISLVTSLYRSERYLPQYVSAVIRAATRMEGVGRRLEIVVVANDASGKERIWIDRLLAAAAETPSLGVQELLVPKETLYASWNRGVGASTSECLGFWNVDDVRNAEALLEGMEMIRGGVELVYFPFVEMTRHTRRFILPVVQVTFPIMPEFERHEFTRSMFVGPFFLFARSLYDRVGPFDEQFRIAGDFDWCTRAAKVTNFSMARSIGGVFIHDGNGLSARGNPRHVVENNIVCMRNQALDKVQPANAHLQAQYEASFRGEAIAAQGCETDGIESSVEVKDEWDEEWEHRRETERRRSLLLRALRKLMTI